ncbi:MAG: ABC transporter ATP-binding protein [Pseudomonadota bacterium]
MAILETKNLTKAFGALAAVNDVSLSIAAGGLHSIIGPNGAGKTTLFNLLSGLLPADAGRIVFAGRDILGKPPHRISRLGIARTLQVKSVFNGLSVYDNVWIAAHSRHPFLHPLKAASAFAPTAREATAALDAVGLAETRDEMAGNLAYGDVALLEIAIAIAMKPKLLLLDEPVAGMSPEETQRTVRKIKALSGTVNILLIEHDMETVFEVADRIAVMAQGGILVQGTAEAIAKDPRVQEAYLGTPEET